jgi:preprotein translocase subunit SecA
VKTPTQDYRRSDFRVPTRLPKGLDARVNQIMGMYQRRAAVLAQLRREAEEIDAQAGEYLVLHDHQLHERLMVFRDQFRRGGRDLDRRLGPALAAIREAADRKLGLRPFLVQIMGALALHRGYLAEMATGEGKTLTAGLAAVLAGWTKRPCHIVTVNDYLVERDADWMRPLYTFCGVRQGCVTVLMTPPDRRKGYETDVTYVTSKELLADFLRDRLGLGAMTNPSRRLIHELLRPRLSAGGDSLVMRGLHTAIVDEADSVLIDEAVTPLIISAPHKNALLEDAVRQASQVARSLEPGTDYQINLRYREIELQAAGRAKLDALCDGLPGLWHGHTRRDELIRQSLTARELFLPNKQYIILNGKVVIVDEFTGRQMPQRTWREGLHQAIEAKEGLAISDPSETMARLSFQRFFRCFSKLAGMTGTAREAASEFWQIYRLAVVSIPTHRPCLRRQCSDRVFPTEAEKWQAVIEEVGLRRAAGQPVLVGTRSVVASETLARLLAGAGLFESKILNALRHKEEASVIAAAGEPGQVTIATNMAGRGTDIRLGQGVAALGGLHVLATERHESGRVDRQLFGRAARQGDPGSSQAFVSLEDELLQRHLPSALHRTLLRTARSRIAGWQPLAHAAFTLAQGRAQTHAFKQRQSVLAADTWLEESLSFAGLDLA